MHPVRTFRIGLLCATAVIAAACSEPTVPEQAAPLVARKSSLRSSTTEASNHLVVTSGTTAANLSASVTSLGGRIERSHDAIGVLTISGLSDAAAAQLEGRGDVLTVTRDAPIQWVAPGFESMTTLQGADVLDQAPGAAANQSGTFFFNQYQWNMRQTDTDDAYDVTDQGTGALVCILDTGIDPGHIELAGKVDLAKSRSFVPSEQFIADLHFHGTFVAGLISGNGRNMASVAPNARLCAVKVLAADGFGSFDWIIAGIMHATDMRADVINMSLGAYFYSKSPANHALIEALQRALDYASNNGSLVVAASGNGGLNLDSDTPDWIHAPSQLQKVISVGATGPIGQTNFDLRAGYSNHGTTGVDMTAPGGNSAGTQVEDGILSICSRFVCGVSVDGRHFYLAGGTGTSFAAPHVSGAAAVFATNTKATGGDNTSLVKRFDARFLEGCLEKGLDRVNIPNMDVHHGKGRLNVKNTMLCGSSPK